MSRFFAYLLDSVRRPREKLSRGQHYVRYSWDLGLHCWRQLRRHRAEGMAAELTYRTIFSLIPVVVLGLVMFRVFGGLDDVRSQVENQLYSYFGVPEVDYSLLTPVIETEAEEEAGGGDAKSDGSVDGEPASEDQESEPEIEEGAEANVDEPVQAGPANGTLPDAGGGRQAVANPNEPAQPEGDAEPAGVSADGSAQVAPELAKPAAPGSSESADGDGADASGANADDASESTDDPAGAIDSEEDAEAKEKAARDQVARASIRRTLSDVTRRISSIDFASIGVFGLLLFIYAAVALADSTEDIFNRIYDAPKQRPIHIRVAIHWSIITLGSGLLALSLYMSGQVVAWFGTIGAGTNVVGVLSHFLAFLASWVLLFLLYALMPNTHVSVQAAGAGALVAALLWEAAKLGFQVYVTTAVPYDAIYGSIGLIPLFLFWIYVTWLIVLFGLILTYTLQTLRGSHDVRGGLAETDLPHGDPDWMLPIMSEVAAAFERGQLLDHQQLADRLGLASRVTHEMVDCLVEAQMLRRVSGGAGVDDSLTLARPAEKIALCEILTVAHQAGPINNHPAWKTLSDLREAEQHAAEGKTLADVQ